MKIQKLPAETRSKLHSGVIVTDAVQCVLELVHNSLDAEATGIAVRVDLKSYQIRVIDNGRGIANDDLEFVGERFMTSKYQSNFNTETSFPTYGFKGQALSSLLEVSRSLIIETKSENEGPTFKKVFQNNKALPIIKSSGEKLGTGTTVTVEDFMHTMPIRRKRINEVFDLEEIKNQLQYLAIIHYNVCFTLRNENKGLILLQTPQASSILESLMNIYGKSLAKSLKTLHYKEKKYEIDGFISIKPQSQSNVQLLFLNKRLITKGVIHKFINSLTKEYSGKNTLLSSSPVGQIMKNLKGSSRNVFIIQIKCPHSYYELFTNIRKTTVEFRNWKDLLKCIHKAVKKTFKNFTNSDILSNSHYHDEEFGAPKDKGEKKSFGTSLLLNAIKGAPAKRSLKIKRDVKKRKKMKVNKITEDFGVSSPKIIDKLTEKPSLIDTFSTIARKKEGVSDSLESPIPKKNFWKVCDSKYSRTANINQSFVEFYEWLKAKFKTDTNAFNFYNDFLQFKNTSSQVKENIEIKSPILGGKLKAKKVAKSEKNLFESQKMLCKDFSDDDGEMAIITKKQLKIFPNVQKRMQKAVQISELKANISENIHLDCIRSGSLKFEDFISQPVFKKPENLIMFKGNRPPVEYSPTLPSSEMQFTNIIKFRNLPESSFRQAYETRAEIPSEKAFNYSVSNSWESHYQDFVPKNIEFLEERRNTKNYFSKPDTQKRGISEKNGNLDFDFYNFVEDNLFEFKNKTKADQRLQNVEIQVDISDIPAQKVDAVVQTYYEIPESPSLENSYVFNQIKFTASGIKSDTDFREDRKKCLQSNISQEVPNPDFWNTSAHLELEKNKNAEVKSHINDLTLKNLTSDVITGKNLTSSEFVCTHKSHSSIEPQNERSTSKETQTIAAIWTESLTELGFTSVKVNLNSEINFSSGNKKSENIEVPKNIPFQEIENVISQPMQTKFCLTERHDFVPKGLSPKFSYPETTKILTLSPLEKSKLKLTIEDTQNELLANIKWQNDSIGDCLKPIIPDTILFEMRRKARESEMNYENPILSASMSYCAVKVHNLLHSFAFTRELLFGVEILGQLDKKFIVTKIQILAPKKMELISLFDQHAVDERIKLEELINENLSDDGKLVSSCLNPPVECFLTESTVRVISDLQEKLLTFGLSIKSVNKNKVLVYEIPTFLLNKHEKDLKNKKETLLSDAIKALIMSILEETMETRGSVSKIPKILYNAFCLEACRKAVKFNKKLTTENMSEMIQKLQNCKLPFQCAHGRPSVIPIIDLEDFNSLMEEENETIDYQELRRSLKKALFDTYSQ